MASYIARVELHYASDSDYTTLHGSMQRRGYSRTIKGSDGYTYALPTGTYDSAVSTASLNSALEAAQAAAAETGKASSIIVADRNGAMWSGLPKV